MWSRRLSVSLVVAVFGVFAATLTGLTQTGGRAPAANQAAVREDAYRANNIGVAMLEQFKYKEAADAFQRALKLDPALALARVNLSIAFYNASDYPAALREAKAAAVALPDSPQAHFVLGLIAKAQNRPPDALASFRRVLQIDPRDPASLINVGQLLMQQRDYPGAIAAFRSAVAAEPYNVTAVYNLGVALTRGGQREEGLRMTQQFQKLREAGYGTTIGQNYLEQGRYSEAVPSTGSESGLVETATPEVTFADATAATLPAARSTIREWAPASSSGGGAGGGATPALKRNLTGALTDATKRDLVASLGGGTTLFDYDRDGDLDLFEIAPFGQRLYRNEGGRFVDVTEASGLGGLGGLAPTSAAAVGIGAVAGDYDNDEKPDLFVLRYGGSSLYHNDGNGKFSDVTGVAAIPAYPHLALSAALVDSDHDGDLDIFIAGFVDLSKGRGAAADAAVFPDDFAGAPHLLLRNNGDGKFVDVTATAGIAGTGSRAVAVVPTDYDNHRDVDLLVVNYNAAPTLFSNNRDGSFRDIAGEAGLPASGRFTCVAAGDVNKDSFTDFFFGNDEGSGVFALSNGLGRYAAAPANPGNLGRNAGAAQFLDYDDDGLLDLVLLTNEAAAVLRNVGGKWENVSERAAAAWSRGADAKPLGPAPLRFASGDLDGDGDTDCVVRYAAGGLKVARNDGGNRNRSLRVRLAGKVSNRSGVGSKIEVRAGSLKQKLETYAASPAPAPADVTFGLGKRTGVDAVRILWPAGILQAETEFAAPAASSTQLLAVTELDRKPSSCPYLYAWNGERFEFVTDFLGGGEMGYRVAPGMYNTPDPDEYVRLRDDQLKVRGGRFELRVTNELEEVLYLDRLQLVAVAHPAEAEIFPNEGMTSTPRPFKIHVTRNARPPLRATDDRGNDVLSRIAQMDRTYADDFGLKRIRGYAEEHALTLDLGGAGPGRTLLLLTGWTDYAFSSDNVAAHQAGLKLMPPALQVKDARGQWQTVISEIGIPVGRPQTVTVDLTGKFLSASREVRLVTTMRIYWDQILVDTSADNFTPPVTRLEAATATLRWRGFSAETTPDGREPYGYDYGQVLPTSPWKVMPGRYTREGDVRELLARTDDRFIISRPGDEVAVSFSSAALPALPKGWRRTFLLYADGFSKEMDINSASPDQVTPLPFHAMKGYPYGPDQSYPKGRAHQEYLRRYNTRVVAAPVPQIETTFAGYR